jgi:tRNA(fMet)-specific endonuclease VapC
MYLFDTDIMSNIVKKRPSPSLMAKLEKVPGEFQFSTAINLGEIYFGASRLPNGAKVIRVFEEKVFSNITILAFDEESARTYGRLKARLEKRGLTKSELDLRIASIALQHRLTLVTGNVRHFKDIPGLKVENWIMD